jgi:mannose/cellobiose epimerase-like protein (N-acyl-D-glucosamine 2-epimerase family)
MNRRAFVRGLAAAVPLKMTELRNVYHRDLYQDFLPFMDRHVVDAQYGGFLCDTDFNGTRVDEFKSPLYEGRGIWVYSYLYSHLGKEARYLDIARRSVELLKRSDPGDGKLWCARLNRDGSPAGPAGEGLPPDLAVVEGLAAYAVASNTQEPLDWARRHFRKCVAIYDRPDYNPNLGRTFLGPNAPEIAGGRNIGMWMLLLRCAQQMRMTDIVDRSIDAVVQRHFNPKLQLNNEILPHDLGPATGEYAELVYAGHTFEITWMILEEALTRRDKGLFDVIAERFKRHADVAWDRVYGGFFHNLQNVDENRFVLSKFLWAQEEVLISALLIHQHTRADWALELFTRTNDYVRSKYPLTSHGSPLWMYAADRQPSFASFVQMPKRIENYHHPRHLMLNLLRTQS